MESHLEKWLVYGHIYIKLGELFYRNDEDVRRKFENYPLMEKNPAVVRAILKPYINRNI